MPHDVGYASRGRAKKRAAASRARGALQGTGVARADLSGDGHAYLGRFQGPRMTKAGHNARPVTPRRERRASQLDLRAARVRGDASGAAQARADLASQFNQRRDAAVAARGARQAQRAEAGKARVANRTLATQERQDRRRLGLGLALDPAQRATVRTAIRTGGAEAGRAAITAAKAGTTLEGKLDRLLAGQGRRRRVRRARALFGDV